ncbi:ArsR/SmtB family transcription factor [Bacillus cereus]|uniref:ArsR/SmtB family transcription factor n=1 Tax=Bacillus cereus TaxID=1396 RepID=UPI0018F62D5A|nr:metalloregulator ArsR/SmtB family transcription factor [Bacillus cereus]MBJ8024904.1 helix-turn-helix transcriptional regulator [Bacillus cereus]MBJ8037424.1 helix-turn-helix transcriptional regulator [Bacillus cereus]
MSKNFNINLDKYEQSADILSVLGNPTRLYVVHMLINKGPLNVSGLWKTMDLPQSTVSQHLLKLKMFKLVSWERKGTEIYYRVDNPTVIKVIKTLEL